MADVIISAQAEFDAVKAEIDKLSRQIGFVSRVLEADPAALKIPDSEPCPPFHRQQPGDYCFESGHWPSAETITALLVRYRAAAERLTKSVRTLTE